MNRLIEIAREKKALRLDRVTQRARIITMTAAAKSTETALIPEGGWPGKNPDERKAAQVLAYDNDPDLGHLRATIEQAKIDLELNEALLEALHDEESAIEWTIRDNGNVILGGASVFDVAMDEMKDIAAETVAELSTELPAEQPQHDEDVIIWQAHTLPMQDAPQAEPGVSDDNAETPDTFVPEI